MQMYIHSLPSPFFLLLSFYGRSFYPITHSLAFVLPQPFFDTFLGQSYSLLPRLSTILRYELARI
jgi:hypothetical protein